MRLPLKLQKQKKRYNQANSFPALSLTKMKATARRSQLQIPMPYLGNVESALLPTTTCIVSSKYVSRFKILVQQDHKGNVPAG